MIRNRFFMTESRLNCSSKDCFRQKVPSLISWKKPFWFQNIHFMEICDNKSFIRSTERICKQATYLQMNGTHTTHWSVQYSAYINLCSSYMCIKVKWKVFCNLGNSYLIKCSNSNKINLKVSDCYFSYLSKGFFI